jgi:hypothetical protein
VYYSALLAITNTVLLIKLKQRKSKPFACIFVQCMDYVNSNSYNCALHIADRCIQVQKNTNLPGSTMVCSNQS